VWCERDYNGSDAPARCTIGATIADGKKSYYTPANEPAHHLRGGCC